MRRYGARCGSLQNLIFEHHAFRIILLQPCFRGVLAGKDLEVVEVTNFRARVDINPDGVSWLVPLELSLSPVGSFARGTDLFRPMAIDRLKFPGALTYSGRIVFIAFFEPFKHLP